MNIITHIPGTWTSLHTFLVYEHHCTHSWYMNIITHIPGIWTEHHYTHSWYMRIITHIPGICASLHTFLEYEHHYTFLEYEHHYTHSWYMNTITHIPGIPTLHTFLVYELNVITHIPGKWTSLHTFLVYGHHYTQSWYMNWTSLHTFLVYEYHYTHSWNMNKNRAYYLSTSCRPPIFVTAAMYFIIIFEASVLPLPDSPLMTIHVSRPCCFISLWAASAIAKTWGGFSNNSLPAQT